MRLSYTTALPSPGTSGRGERLRGASCAGLPAPVVDRYWHGGHGARDDRFAHATARTICASCPVLLACLTDAIRVGVPSRARQGVIAGLPAYEVAALRWQSERERIPAEVLARRVVARLVPPLRGAYGHASWRAGRMPDHMPLAPTADD